MPTKQVTGYFCSKAHANEPSELQPDGDGPRIYRTVVVSDFCSRNVVRYSDAMRC